MTRATLDWVPERWRPLAEDVSGVIGLAELTDLVCMYCVPIVEFHRHDKPHTVGSHNPARNGAYEYDSTVPLRKLSKRPWCLEVFPPATSPNVLDLSVLTVSLIDANYGRSFGSWHSTMTAGSHRILTYPVIAEYSCKYILKLKGEHTGSAWADCKQMIADQVPTRLEFTDRVPCVMGQERIPLGLVADFSNHVIRIELYRYQLVDNNLDHPHIVASYF